MRRMVPRQQINEPGGKGNHHAGQRHLQRLLADGDELLRPRLQADHEEQEHRAQLSQRINGSAGNHQRHGVRPQQRPSQDLAQNCR